jgi:uncharacterized LabA/DUF88 family protein
MKTVCIYWDFQNVPDLKIADSVLKLAKSKGKLIKPVVYDNWNQNKSKIKNRLEAQGFRCYHVKLQQKNAADNELLIDLGMNLGKYPPDTIILITGDHFASIAVDKVKQLNKQIIVIAREKSCNPDLKKKADEFYTTEEIKKHPNLL